MAVKSLRSLLDQADTFIKKASGPATEPAETSVSALVSILTGADTEVTLTPEEPLSFEKSAEALNRLLASAEIEEFKKLAGFQKRAAAEGYTGEQIDEALMKLESEKIAKSLPLLATMGIVGVKSTTAQEPNHG